MRVPSATNSCKILIAAFLAIAGRAALGKQAERSEHSPTHSPGARPTCIP